MLGIAGTLTDGTSTAQEPGRVMAAYAGVVAVIDPTRTNASRRALVHFGRFLMGPIIGFSRKNCRGSLVFKMRSAIYNTRFARVSATFLHYSLDLGHLRRICCTIVSNAAMGIGRSMRDISAVCETSPTSSCTQSRTSCMSPMMRRIFE